MVTCATSPTSHTLAEVWLVKLHVWIQFYSALRTLHFMTSPHEVSEPLCVHSLFPSTVPSHIPVQRLEMPPI